MPIIPTPVMRTNLRVLSPFLKQANILTARALQDAMGELMTRFSGREARISDPLSACGVEAVWCTPRQDPLPGAVLYLHGGGYTAGDLPYATGFGSALASELERRVLCAAYRLAPEHPFPAALEDAVSAYDHLLAEGYAPEEILLCGESAGGGLCLALCLLLRARGRALPRAVVAISPWTDLTLSGASLRENANSDPCLTLRMLEYYADAYAGENREDPLVSPLFGSFGPDFPPCQLFAGGDEMILSDTIELAKRLGTAGVQVRLFVEPEMWHAYVLYGVKESKRALERIRRFADELLS